MSISWDPLYKLTYQTDAHKVHQMIHGFMKGETSKTWIKPIEKKRDVQVDFK